MTGKPPIVRLAYRDDDGEFQLMGTFDISELGCVPAVGDVYRDTLVEWCEPYRVRRRVFIQVTGEPDTWWILVDRLPDDDELDRLVVFDAEIRAEFKAIDAEHRAGAFDRMLARAKAEKSR